MNTAIILSSFAGNDINKKSTSNIPKYDGLDINKRYYDSIKKYFPNSPIFIGINPGSFTNEWINIVKDEKYKVTPEHLILGSDASGYQSALSIMPKDQQYDYVLFCHTRRPHTSDIKWLPFYEKHIFRKIDYIDAIFRGNKEIGIYGYDYKMDAGKDKINNDRILQYLDIPRKEYVPIVLLFTFYVIRGDLMYWFMNNAKPEFFETKLDSRYFFEDQFYKFIYHLGYKPYVEYKL